jgi:hypothetical protein
MTGEAPRQKRLDEMVAPGWASLCQNLLRGGGVVTALLLLWIGVVTGGFFLLLTGVLAAIALVGGWLLGELMVRESWYEHRNTRVPSLILVVAFPVVLVLFAQLAGPALTPPPSMLGCFAGTPSRGGELHTQLAVDPRIKSMQFTLQLSDVGGGALRWFVQDPTGQSRWSGREEQPGTYTSDPIGGFGGKWTVNVISEADRATYELDWRSLDPATNEPNPPCLMAPG